MAGWVPMTACVRVHTLLLLLFASTKFCDFGIPTILRVLIFAISRSGAKFCDSHNQGLKSQV